VRVVALLEEDGAVERGVVGRTSDARSSRGCSRI